MQNDQILDHLFRFEYGKMVSSLTRIFGINNLELVEDAVQDSFHKATIYFRENGVPENPAAWLRKVARNRIVDLFRKVNVQNKNDKFSDPSAISMNEVFSEDEIEDNQLRLLFTICHPSLKLRDQIIFALKTFSGFTHHEIAHALLLTSENVKKTLSRARKNIKSNKIEFQVPGGKGLSDRLENVHLVIYLLFNEGFHSSGKDHLIRKDLVAEALRLNGLLIDRFQNSNTKALMAMMCFHAARLDSKISPENDLIKLKYQDRNLWNKALIDRGHYHMNEAVKSAEFSRFHWEAAIAGEYARTASFETINWKNLEKYHRSLIASHPTPINQLNLCVIINQQGRPSEALSMLETINLGDLKGKEHLYYSVSAEIYRALGNLSMSISHLENALKTASNKAERKLITAKIKELTI